ncbi:MAG: sigma-54-dependent Fis family transcriptional regulator [Planctomycetes bacterium]|nr:sigma-54-dependent Fis family transcriptional regulator [Planctomycetota bacterium]
MSKPKVLIVDDEAAMRMGLVEVLKRADYDVEAAEDGEQAIARIDQGGLDVVVTDLRMPGCDGMTVLRHARERDPNLLVYMISAHGDVPTAVEAMKHGAQDFIQKPFKIDDVRARIRAGLDKRELTQTGRASVPRPATPEGDVAAGAIDDGIWDEFPGLVGRCDAMARVLHTVKKVASSPLPVLVRGETGTGKELIARALHDLSGRKGPFVATTGQIPEGLIESELFGHVKGAFTGADRDKVGYFEAAANGTLFLDELGDLPQSVQVKLLRAIQEKEIVRVGESKPRKVNARLVAATWRDLDAEVAAKRFREDLLYRLNVLTLWLPPLRERGDDLLVLAEAFLQRAAAENGRRLSFGEDAKQRLLAHGWKGNVRELENACMGMAVLAAEDVLGAEDVDMALS